MNGFLAQAIALVCHGNPLLQGHELTHNLARTNSAFKYAKQVVFSEPWLVFFRRKTDDANQWLQLLKQRGSTALSLKHTTYDDYSIVVHHAEYSTRWVANHKYMRKGSGGWLVRYTNTSRERACNAEGIAIEPASRALELAVRDALAVARANKLDFFANLFECSLLSLTEMVRSQVYHPDLAPPGSLSPRASTLLDACQQASVFGGMGSWNDVTVNDPEEYNRASAALQDALRTAFIAATNSSSGAANSKSH